MFDLTDYQFLGTGITNTKIFKDGMRTVWEPLSHYFRVPIYFNIIFEDWKVTLIWVEK